MNDPPGSCGTDLYQGSYADFDISYESPPPTGGVCTSPGAATGSGITYTAHERACTPTAAEASGCSAGGCKVTVPTPYSACVVATGNVACPSGPFSVAHSVGTSASASCDACSCAVSSTCQGTVTLYTDSACKKTPSYSVTADDHCDPIYMQRASYNSYIYTGGAPKNLACTGSGPAVQGVSLVAPQTICCMP